MALWRWRVRGTIYIITIESWLLEELGYDVAAGCGDEEIIDVDVEVWAADAQVAADGVLDARTHLSRWIAQWDDAIVLDYDWDQGPEVRLVGGEDVRMRQRGAPELPGLVGC
jgi:hypothetical protein